MTHRTRETHNNKYILSIVAMCTALIVGLGGTGCATARHAAEFESASQAVAAGLGDGGDEALAGVLGRYDEVRVYVRHTAVEAPFDVIGQRLVGAGAVAAWARRLHAQSDCADPDACVYASLETPNDSAAWRCAGGCCEVDIPTPDHRRLYLERVCFELSPLRVWAIHLVDGD